jgi:hypothetical protein
MKSVDDIRRYFRNATLSANPEIHERVFADVLRAHQQTPAEGSKRNVIVGLPLQEPESSWSTRPALHEATAKRRIMRIATPRILIAALIGTGVVTAAAAVVGVKIRHYYFEGRGADGSYHFSKEPEVIYPRPNQTADGAQGAVLIIRAGGTAVPVSNPQQTIDIEQTRKDLEEIDRLRRQDLRRLVGVTDIEVNGHPCHRSFRYEYTLADGRTTTIGENRPEASQAPDPAQIEKDHAEIDQLRQQNRRELVAVSDMLIQGKLYRMCRYCYLLADGREITLGEPDPELPWPPPLPGVDVIREVWKLRELKQGALLGREDRDVHGRPFAFETYLFTLPDGTVVTHALGEPKGARRNLNPGDFEELRRLREAGKVQKLGVQEKTVLGRVFSFRKERILLSDGTEVIFSMGIPKDNP